MAEKKSFPYVITKQMCRDKGHLSHAYAVYESLLTTVSLSSKNNYPLVHIFFAGFFNILFIANLFISAL